MKQISDDMPILNFLAITHNFACKAFIAKHRILKPPPRIQYPCVFFNNTPSCSLGWTHFQNDAKVFLLFFQISKYQDWCIFSDKRIHWVQLLWKWILWPAQGMDQGWSAGWERSTLKIYRSCQTISDDILIVIAGVVVIAIITIIFMSSVITSLEGLAA